MLLLEGLHYLVVPPSHTEYDRMRMTIAEHFSRLFKIKSICMWVLTDDVKDNLELLFAH